MSPSLLKLQFLGFVCMEFSSQGCWWVFLKIHIFLPARMAGQLIVKLSAKHVFISRLRSTINANWGNNVNTITFASKGRLSAALNWKINRFHMISSNQRDTIWSSVVSKIAMFLYRKWVEENTNNFFKKCSECFMYVQYLFILVVTIV